MQGMRILVAACASAMLLGTANACARPSETAAGEVVPVNSAALQLRNDDFLDLDVFAVTDGMATRLGTVTGNASDTFVLDPSMMNTDLQIVATPIGGNGRASTGKIIVAPGEIIEFRVGYGLKNNTVYIR